MLIIDFSCVHTAVSDIIKQSQSLLYFHANFIKSMEIRWKNNFSLQLMWIKWLNWFHIELRLLWFYWVRSNKSSNQFFKNLFCNMLNMRPYVPSTRIAVRESIDEDLSDDIEDDVFIRDGKSIKVTFKILLFCFATHRVLQQCFEQSSIYWCEFQANMSYLPEKIREALYEKCPVAY